MGAAIARRLLGGTVLIESCGVETENGLPAAKLAIEAMKEVDLDLDLAEHRTRSVDGFDLAQYDLIIAMDHSIEERLRSLGVRSDRLRALDVCDPYDGTLDLYRARRDEITAQLRDILGLQGPGTEVQPDEA
jgi:protein-tyrosine-phosphatase